VFRYLDDHIEQIGFQEGEWRLSERRIPQERSFVFQNYVDYFADVSAAMHLLLLPVYYFRLNDGRDLLVIPVSELPVEEVDRVISDLRASIPGHEDQLVPYVQYKHGGDRTDDMITLRSFTTWDNFIDDNTAPGAHDAKTAAPAGQADVPARDGDADEWKSISRTADRARRQDQVAFQRRDRCSFGYFCVNLNGSQQCRYLHSPEQMAWRATQASQPRPRKNSKCRSEHDNLRPCVHNQRPSGCPFLHDGEIPMCNWCMKQHSPNCYT